MLARANLRRRQIWCHIPQLAAERRAERAGPGLALGYNTKFIIFLSVSVYSEQTIAFSDMEMIKDKNGKTEAEFLREYDVTQYFRPSVTVDAVLVKPHSGGGKILLIKRGGHPFISHWAFPGGFVEEDEPCEVAAPRELFEETGIRGVPLKQLVTASTPERDPRWRNITVVFFAEVDGEIEAVGGDDAAFAEWFDFNCSFDKGERETARIKFDGKGVKFECVLDVARDAFGDVDLNNTVIIERGALAFDHAKIVCYIADRMMRSVK